MDFLLYHYYEDAKSSEERKVTHYPDPKSPKKTTWARKTRIQFKLIEKSAKI